jgi:hypothetical protein
MLKLNTIQLSISTYHINKYTTHLINVNVNVNVIHMSYQGLSIKSKAVMFVVLDNMTFFYNTHIYNG